MTASKTARPRGPARASEGVIDITVTPSPGDLRVLARFAPYRAYHRITTILARIGAGALAGAATGASLWFYEPDQTVLSLLTATLTGLVAGIAAFRFASERSWSRRLRRELVDRDAVRVLADGVTLTIMDDAMTRSVALSALDLVAETASHLVLFCRQAPLIALPKAAFPNRDEAAAFAGFLRATITTHQAPEETSP